MRVSGRPLSWQQSGSIPGAAGLWAEASKQQRFRSEKSFRLKRRDLVVLSATLAAKICILPAACQVAKAEQLRQLRELEVFVGCACRDDSETTLQAAVVRSRGDLSVEKARMSKRHHRHQSKWSTWFDILVTRLLARH